MLTGFILLIVFILFFIFFAVYKRDMLTKMFSLNASQSAGEFQAELEKTADNVIKRLETHIAHLELLLEEADQKIALLDQKLQTTNPLPTAAPEITEPSLFAAATISEQQPAFELALSDAGGAQQLDNNLATKDHKETISIDKRRLIFTMAQQGYNVTEIAKTTGVGKGEIMLLLQLHKK